MVVVEWNQSVQELLHLLQVHCVLLAQVRTVYALDAFLSLPLLALDLPVLVHLTLNHVVGLLNDVGEGYWRLLLHAGQLQGRRCKRVHQVRLILRRFVLGDIVQVDIRRFLLLILLLNLLAGLYLR